MDALEKLYYTVALSLVVYQQCGKEVHLITAVLLYSIAILYQEEEQVELAIMEV